uniref:Uncharacterized protein n=1 Tax=Anguilla anguilla TaxID=7936 RepID=A0A0E9PDF1_ANGAN
MYGKARLSEWSLKVDAEQICSTRWLGWRKCIKPKVHEFANFQSAIFEIK